MESRLMLSGTEIDTDTFNTDSLTPDYAVISPADSFSAAEEQDGAITAENKPSLDFGRNAFNNSGSQPTANFFNSFEADGPSSSADSVSIFGNANSLPTLLDLDGDIHSDESLLQIDLDADNGWLTRDDGSFATKETEGLQVRGTAVTGLIGLHVVDSVDLSADLHFDGTFGIVDIATEPPKRLEIADFTFSLGGHLRSDHLPDLNVPIRPSPDDVGEISGQGTATVVTTPTVSVPTAPLDTDPTLSVPAASDIATNLRYEAVVTPATPREPVADIAEPAPEQPLADVIDELVSQDTIIVVQSPDARGNYGDEASFESGIGVGVTEVTEPQAPLDSNPAAEEIHVAVDVQQPAEGGMISIDAIASALAAESMTLAEIDGRPISDGGQSGGAMLADAPTEMVGELARAVAFEMIEADSAPVAATTVAAHDRAIESVEGVVAFTLSRATASVGVLPLAAVVESLAGWSQSQLTVQLSAADEDVRVADALVGSVDESLATADFDGEIQSGEEGIVATESDTIADWRTPFQASALLVMLAMEQYVSGGRKREQKSAGPPKPTRRHSASASDSRREAEC